MKRFSLFLCGLMLAALPSAFADTFNFSFTGSDFSGAGIFDAQATNNASRYRITDVSGTVDTGNGQNRVIAGILAPGSFGNNDNLLFFPARANGAFFDIQGVAFSLLNGAEVNLYSSASADLMRVNGNVISEIAAITVTPVASAVPEPGSMALLGTGALGVIGVVRRKLTA